MEVVYAYLHEATPKSGESERCRFADAEVLKGRWASALLGSYTVGHDTGDNFMLV